MGRSAISSAIAGAVAAAALGASAVAAQTPPPELSQERWIVYNGAVGDRSGIRIVRADGTGDRALFAGQFDGEAWHPDWSHDGDRIAFAVDDADGTRDLWVGTFDGAEAERIFDCSAPCSWADDPAWSPDDRAILFQQGTALGDEGLGVGTLEILDLESSEVRTLVSGSDGEYLYVPRWAPDGERIVVEVDLFASARLDESEVLETSIAIVDASAADPRPVSIVSDRRAVHPDWSPDGDTIVFQAPLDPASPDGPSDLHVVPAAGGDPIRLTTTGIEGRQALQPSWTWEGRVIFVEQDGMFENVRMAVIGADGRDLASATGAEGMSGTHPRLGPPAAGG